MQKTLDGKPWLKQNVKPYPKDRMEIENARSDTICGVLRNIYKKTQDEEIKTLSRIAVSMAKKMSKKLIFYSELYEK